MYSKKRQGGEVNPGASKKTKNTDRTAPRTWTSTEEMKLASYFAEHPYLGKDQAKQSFANYLRKMLEKLEIHNCDYKQMSNKYSSMKTKYEKTRAWINETGQGVQDGDRAGFPDKVMQMCSYYYIVDSVWGCSQAINTSYQRDCGEVIVGLNNDWEKEEDNLPADILCANGTEETEVVLSDTENSSQTLAKHNAKSATKFEEAVSLSTKQNRPGKGNASAQILNFLETREDNRSKTDESKLAWEKDKCKLEQETLLQMKTQECEMEIKKAEINRDVEMKKLDVENKRLELELMKLQLANPNAT